MCGSRHVTLSLSRALQRQEVYTTLDFEWKASYPRRRGFFSRGKKTKWGTRESRFRVLGPSTACTDFGGKPEPGQRFPGLFQKKFPGEHFQMQFPNFQRRKFPAPPPKCWLALWSGYKSRNPLLRRLEESQKKSSGSFPQQASCERGRERVEERSAARTLRLESGSSIARESTCPTRLAGSERGSS